MIPRPPRRPRSARPPLGALLGTLALGPLLASCAGLPGAVPNDMRHAVGEIHGDTSYVHLTVTVARWRPDTSVARWVEAEMFAEEGHAPSVPGPLVRAPAGGTLVVSVRNPRPDTLLIIGLGRHILVGQTSEGDTLFVAPGQTVTATYPAGPTRVAVYYGAMRSGQRLRDGGAGFELAGVLQVGDLRPQERILAINAWGALQDSTKPDAGDWILWTINGQMWPSTERFEAEVGDTLRWRIVDLTADNHPMHLHGFYFRVDGRSTWDTDSVFPPDRRWLAVTEAPPPGGTLSITWSPTRPGSWLFHCHKAPHMSELSRMSLMRDTTEPPMAAHLDPAEHLRTGMSGLILGIDVNGPAAPPDTARPATHFRLLIQRRAHTYGATDGYGYVLQRGAAPDADSIDPSAPALVLTRDSLTTITVVNHLPVATTVHWHGMEVEGYYDGVGGWSGVPGHRTPILDPGDSFTVAIRPSRAGTFIYHTHISEGTQLYRGLVGPLLVLEPGEPYDPATDHVVLVHQVPSGDTTLVVADRLDGSGPLRAGVPQRFRFINLILDAGATITLTPDSTPARWRPVAKDGATLPPALAVERDAQVRIYPGETFDAAFTPRHGVPESLVIRSFQRVKVPLPVR